ncbi:MAG: signal recognition particle protein [Candidatus Eisenbacteria bacterium]|uniref:Signal recognition particle protein n=2 Tax=Eiseniibacteriota bacterium TaxID=2212470 RepID=A0A538SR43_UNCEI|nr:MAG: signal recognition particle protein [Candidatus Eisenbacteria bacterium]
MFDELTTKLAGVFRKLTGRGRLGEQDVRDAVREIRRVLLEADVNLAVARDLCKRVETRAVGVELLQSVSPGQQVVKIVFDELVSLLGGTTAAGMQFPSNRAAVVLMVGLQGSGKTTSAAKLARHWKERGKRVLLTALDLRRPAAIDQLEVLGKSIDAPVYLSRDASDPVLLAEEARSRADREGFDLLIADTAGRLHVDEELMAEVARLQGSLQPTETLLVLDGMTGQDAVLIAEAFTKRLRVTGFVLTKMDGDARGGAALSLRAVCGAPIRYLGVGEKVEALEAFHADRLASRILGMGDVVTLVERAQERLDHSKAEALEKKLRKEGFTLEDFLGQLQEMKKLGPMDELLKMLPGVKVPAGVQLSEQELRRTEAIIQSMTRQERTRPQVIDGSRRKRIARGSGTTVQDVNRLLRQFEQTRTMLKRFGGKRGRLPMGMP